MLRRRRRSGRGVLTVLNPPDPRVLLIGGERAILYLFDGGDLQHAYLFSADDAGLALFERCLRELPPAPVAVLVDVVEEAYRQETVPHVGASDRRAVLERKYARLFRGTPYHHALRQGRETEGRRDDRVHRFERADPGHDPGLHAEHAQRRYGNHVPATFADV